MSDEKDPKTQHYEGPPFALEDLAAQRATPRQRLNNLLPLDIEEETPLLCFEQDIDAGIAAAQELTARGFAPLPGEPGIWMISKEHVEKIQAQLKTLAQAISARSPSHPSLAPKEVIDAQLKLGAAFNELYRLLPGGEP